MIVDDSEHMTLFVISDLFLVLSNIRVTTVTLTCLYRQWSLTDASCEGGIRYFVTVKL